MPANKKIHVFGGGTFHHVRNHLSLAAPAFGLTASTLSEMFEHWVAQHIPGQMDVELHLTKMANPLSKLVTNADVLKKIDELVADSATKIVVLNCALVDFAGVVDGVAPGKHAPRLTSAVPQTMQMVPATKIVERIRKNQRKDIFLVAFKTTTDATSAEQFQAGLSLMKRASCNLVVANDTVTRRCMIITPEEVRYADGIYNDLREDLLRELVDMTMLRSQLTFTRSTVVAADPVPWDSPLVPDNLRKVVDFCIEQGAYKTGPTGATVGHFAVKLDPQTFLTSRRKTNYNDMAKVGLVKIRTDSADTVIAYGSKPSVGGQSQRIVFEEHEGYDCICHFHCPLHEDALDADLIPVVSQREYECGSHQCGENTSRGLAEVAPGIKVVMLDKHGPNIVFSKDTNPDDVISVIVRNFDLSRKTT